jgi:hypothetical protein
LIKPLRLLSRGVTKLLDTWVINGTLHGLRDASRVSGQLLSLFHTGSVQTYAWYFAAATGVAVALLWAVIR